MSRAGSRRAKIAELMDQVLKDWLPIEEKIKRVEAIASSGEAARPALEAIRAARSLPPRVRHRAAQCLHDLGGQAATSKPNRASETDP